MTGLTVYTDLVQRSDDWYEARRGIVTASVMGDLLTSTLKVADNDTSRGLLRTLVAERITGHVEDTYTSADMLRGVMDEPIAREHYARHIAPVTECGFMVRELVNGARVGWSPDGLVGDDGCIEIKSRAPKAHLATILADEVPAANMAQIQTALFVSGRAWCDYVSWCGGMPAWVIRVHPDEAWNDAIAAAVTTFERNATDALSAYYLAVDGLPATERIDYYQGEAITF